MFEYTRCLKKRKKWKGKEDSSSISMSRGRSSSRVVVENENRIELWPGGWLNYLLAEKGHIICLRESFQLCWNWLKWRGRRSKSGRDEHMIMITRVR